MRDEQHYFVKVSARLGVSESLVPFYDAARQGFGLPSVSTVFSKDLEQLTTLDPRWVEQMESDGLSPESIIAMSELDPGANLKVTTGLLATVSMRVILIGNPTPKLAVFAERVRKEFPQVTSIEVAPWPLNRWNNETHQIEQTALELTAL